jgi:hypothetical protein
VRASGGLPSGAAYGVRSGLPVSATYQLMLEKEADVAAIAAAAEAAAAELAGAGTGLLGLGVGGDASDGRGWDVAPTDSEAE